MEIINTTLLYCSRMQQFGTQFTKNLMHPKWKRSYHSSNTQYRLIFFWLPELLCNNTNFKTTRNPHNLIIKMRKTKSEAMMSNQMTIKLKKITKRIRAGVIEERKGAFLNPSWFIGSPGAKVEFLKTTKQIDYWARYHHIHVLYIQSRRVMRNIFPTFHNRSIGDFHINLRNSFL